MPVQVRIPDDLSSQAQIIGRPFAEFILSGAEGLRVTGSKYYGFAKTST